MHAAFPSGEPLFAATFAGAFLMDVVGFPQEVGFPAEAHRSTVETHRSTVGGG